MKETLYQIDDALLSRGVVNKEQLDKAKEVQKTERIGLEDAVVKLGYSSYQEIIQCLSAQYDLPVIDLDKTNILPEVIKSLPLQIAKKYQILPVSKDNSV